jgi:hypothetical protein
MSRVRRPGPNGDGIWLATLPFVGSATGLFDLGSSLDLLYPNEGLFTFNSVAPYDLTHSMQITISAAVGGAPEPATLVLLGFSIAGIGYQRRK